MKLLSVNIESSESCGGILNGLDVSLRDPLGQQAPVFNPICLVGPNGTGKSQFLQTLAEIFQEAWHVCSPTEERQRVKSLHVFSLEYLVWPDVNRLPVHVRLERTRNDPRLRIETFNDGVWEPHDPTAPPTRTLLPSRIIGYTSGANETLSLPFFTSRAGYAEEVRTRALPPKSDRRRSPRRKTLPIRSSRGSC